VAYEQTFARNLRMLLAKQGMSQKDLAASADVTEAAVSRYVKGDRIPTLETAARIADQLGCTLDQLMGREPVTSG
jgi:transcriptional regulator with XRE-family HTH domain